MERRIDRTGGSALKGAYTFALIASFTVLSLLIVLAGAKVYRRVTQTAERNFTSRTALAYVANKVRGTDESGMVNVTELDGGAALVLGAIYGGQRYDTAIYYDEGYLCECFYSADRGFDRKLGDRLVAVNGLAFTMENSLLSIEITDQDGLAHGLSLYLQSDGEVEP